MKNETLRQNEANDFTLEQKQNVPENDQETKAMIDKKNQAIAKSFFRKVVDLSYQTKLVERTIIVFYSVPMNKLENLDITITFYPNGLVEVSWHDKNNLLKDGKIFNDSDYLKAETLNDYYSNLLNTAVISINFANENLQKIKQAFIAKLRKIKATEVLRKYNAE